MISPHHRRLVAFCCFALLLLALRRPVAHAGPPTPRPYIELPFPRGYDYEVTCGYTCYQHKNSMSYAVDFDVPTGDPIVAAASGNVMAVTWEVGLPLNLDLGDALIVYIDHGGGWFTRYVHLSGITVEVGDPVEMGQVIGYGGKTGASGDHLHFELKYGTSLHSPSVPIDELFDGQPPVAGERYVSNNWALSDRMGTPRPLAPPPPHPTRDNGPILAAAAPEADSAASGFLPVVTAPLTLSSPTVRVGEPVTLTFTLQNPTGERLHLSVLGVGDQAGEGSNAGYPLFDRSVVLNAGRSFTFSRQVRFAQTGENELFIFALGPQNEWIPLEGEGATRTVHVEPAPATLYLPFVGAGNR